MKTDGKCQQMLSYKIVGQCPLIDEIINKLVFDYSIKKIAFIDYPLFKWGVDLEFEELETNKKTYGKYGVEWSWEHIKDFLPHMDLKPNIISFFTSEEVTNTKLKFCQWDLVYHCYDRNWVELLTCQKKIIDRIYLNYDVKVLEYPGLLKESNDFNIDI